jgi:hypothetical protein
MDKVWNDIDSSSSAFGYDHLYSQTVALCKIGRSPQVVRCASKLGLEGRRLLPKVLLMVSL